MYLKFSDKLLFHNLFVYNSRIKTYSLLDYYPINTSSDYSYKFSSGNISLYLYIIIFLIYYMYNIKLGIIFGENYN